MTRTDVTTVNWMRFKIYNFINGEGDNKVKISLQDAPEKKFEIYAYELMDLIKALQFMNDKR